MPYDRNSNPIYCDIDSAIYATDDKDQAYTYDGLHRVTNYDRGTLSGSPPTMGTPNHNHDLTYDQLGTGRHSKSISRAGTLNSNRPEAQRLAKLQES